MKRLPIHVLAAMAFALGACANPREEAREELGRLRAAMEQHAARYGAYPQTIDAARPASATNLPHRPQEGVTVELVHAGADGFQALARRPPWVCTMGVDARHAQRLECAPLTSQAPPAAPGSRAANPLDSVLHSPAP
jgi:hypothetical protein